MFFWFHLVYTLVFIVYIFSFLFGKSPDTKEEYMILPRYEQDKLKAKAYKLMALVLIFPVMNGFLWGSFGVKFWFHLVQAGFFCLGLWFNRSYDAVAIEKFRWVPYVGFLVCAIWKNIIVIDSTFLTILAHIQSVIAVAFVWFVCAVALRNTVAPDTKEAQEEAARKNQQRLAEIEAREAQERYEEEQRRIQAEKDARIHEAYERVVLGKKTGSSGYGSSYSSGRSYLDTYTENYLKRGEMGAGTATDCCSNCRHYSGGVCTCSQSRSHNQTIFNPNASCCGWHS